MPPHAVKSSKSNKETIQIKKGNPKRKRFDEDGNEVKLEEDGHNRNEMGTNMEQISERKEYKKLTTKSENNDQEKWYNVYPQFPSNDDILDMKESEQMKLFSLCKTSYEKELPLFLKRNPSDSRWLQTALHKGTAKDRANAGALLITSNPLGNLEALATLVSSTKVSNKASSDIVAVLTDLWIEVLLPPHRKLLSIPMRAADWKMVNKDSSLTKEKLQRIYAFWHFENELKENYFEFLKNLQYGVQSGQESNKSAGIISASQLLAYAPEKEQMLLSMLINKLGDPLPKIASKALHHLTEVAHKHPNMCGVIVAEAEKLLFRNNISERAQHFALCFLACIAPSGRPEVCTKLVNICFALFKVLVQKGTINNRTMQAILRCLQKAILEAKPAEGSDDVMTKDMQDTIYRLVHLADIRISVQTLSLLLQLVIMAKGNSDRFYNALYKKMLDLELISIGTKTAAQLLHIIHRAIHVDANLPRAQAFVKRMLQMALHMPAPMSAGCLIVLHKLLRTRRELVGTILGQASDANVQNNQGEPVILPKLLANDEELAKFDSDGEEKYEDHPDVESTSNEKRAKQLESSNEINDAEDKSHASSWHHTKIVSVVSNTSQISASKYDPYHRVPSYAGAEYSWLNELILLREHFHPSVQVFANNILNQQRIDYYGDPLRDFSLSHFLERFCFKNPKKLDQAKIKASAIPHNKYVSFGSRGKPVKSLTANNCTEDEMFIFNFLEQKRKQAALFASQKANSDGDKNFKSVEVDDDEFEEYLDGYFGKKNKGKEEQSLDLDFMKELGDGILKTDADKNRKKKRKVDDDESDEDANMADVNADWGDNEDVSNDEYADDNNASDEELVAGEDDDYSDNKSQVDSDDEMMFSENEDEPPPKSKKLHGNDAMLDSRSFAKKLKHSDDMSSLFAAADDFAELLEETGKAKGQGTSNAIFNTDKSSEKQLKWEEKRRSNAKNYKKKNGKKVSRKKPEKPSGRKEKK